ncbi:MAG: DUF4363 family protein [Ruminococcaceae bacterium]|nr:DUF4363 family protein [Oscillospiraceae bacterium]
MKSFIIALVVLLIVCTFVFFNSFYFLNLYDDFIKDTENLPKSVYDKECENAINSLCDKVDKKTPYLYTVLQQQNVDQLLTCLSEARSAAYLKNESNYITSVDKAILLLKLTKDNEDFPFLANIKSKKRYFP